MWALEYSINLITPKSSWFENYTNLIMKKLKELHFNCNIKDNHEDIELNSIAIYLSYHKIVPMHFIEKAHQSIVVHASDLPKGKGFSPWVWQILEGNNCIPICLFQMMERLDEGDIFQKKLLQLDGTELLEKIRDKLGNIIVEMVLEHLTQKQKPEGAKQIGKSTFYRKRSSSDSEINPNISIGKQFNLLRIVDNTKYPAFFHYKNKKYILRIEQAND